MGVDADEFKPREDKWANVGKAILFTGHLEFGPNLDAIEWLVNDIYQKHDLKSKGIRCVIAGRKPSEDLKQLCLDAGVELVGDAPTLKPYFDDALIYVVRRVRIVESARMVVSSCRTPTVWCVWRPRHPWRHRAAYAVRFRSRGSST